MNKKIILVFGSGHLALRLKEKLAAGNHQVVHATFSEISKISESVSLIDDLKIYINKLQAGSVSMIYLLDEKDEVNLQLIIAFNSIYPGIPVAASMFNENLIPHLQAGRSNITILNPAKIAAPHFVAALMQPLTKNNSTGLVNKTTAKSPVKKDRLIEKLLLAFVALIVAAVLFFHFYEKLSWIDSVYFVIVTITSVGYGDINLGSSTTLSKIAGIVLILLATVFIWMIFSFAIDSLIKKRIMLAMGRKKYRLKDHIILCGLGKLGFFIAQELLQKGEKLIIIEQNENVRYLNYFRQLGAEVYIGDGRSPEVLNDVHVAQAKALISSINNDAVNMEIGLNSRSFQPGIRLILRIFDGQMAEKIKDYFNIHLTLSASNIAYQKFAEILG